MDGAVTALLAVVAHPADPSDGDDAVAGLAEVTARAVNGDAVAVWIHDQRLDAGRMVASSGLTEDAWEALAAAAEADRPEGAVEVSPDGEGPLARALSDAGASHAVVVPVSDASRGLVMVAGSGPLDSDPLRRAALAAGAERIGSVVDAMRMRDNLERAMAQILATDERMLGRMGLDIHDGPTQQLSVALLEVQLLEADIADAAEGELPTPESLRPALGRIYETVGGALHEMRELIGHLRPAQFEDRNLEDILGDALTAFEARADVEVTSEFVGDFPVNGVSITQRITLYRILQETLSNAQRHGRAGTSTCSCSTRSAGRRSSVRDDGAGFDPEAVQRRKPGMPLARFGSTGCATARRSWAGRSTCQRPGRRRDDPRVPAALGGPAPRWRSMWPDRGRQGEGVRPDRADEAARARGSGCGGSASSSPSASPRHVGVGRRRRCAVVRRGRRPGGRVRAASPGVMADTARRAGLTHLQVHGDADPAAAAEASGLPVIQGVRVDGAAAIARARASVAGLVLLDAAVAGLHGGTGTAFDWALLDGEPLGRPFALAGGLTPENVGEAVRRTSPALVNVSSGVEASPGRKDPERVAAFVAAVAGGRRRGRVSERTSPDEALTSRYGPFGGRYVPETVIAALDELSEAYLSHRDDLAFRAELEGLLTTYVGRPTPLYRARGLEEAYGVERLYLKREDLCHTGAHKIDNALGQVLLASKMGKRRIIAETGAGPARRRDGHGGRAARPGLPRLHGPGGHGPPAAQRDPHADARRRGGPGRLGHRDAEGRAQRGDPRLGHERRATTHYVIGTAAGPAPYPEIVAELQAVIGARGARADAGRGGAPAGGGRRLRRRRLERDRDLPGLPRRRRRGARRASRRAARASRPAATAPRSATARPGVLHGTFSYLLQSPEGQVTEPHSISAGLDYPGVGPEHSFLRDTGRVRYVSATDAEALPAFEACSRSEGIIPALESSHALALVAREGADPGGRAAPVLVCLSGRGDKDVDAVGAALGLDD